MNKSCPTGLTGRKQEAMAKPKEATLTFVGCDSWDRPVYERNGVLYVDVDPRPQMQPNICTKAGNEFDGEPDSPIRADVEITFVPKRYTW